jgi:hypothetical protein
MKALILIIASALALAESFGSSNTSRFFARQILGKVLSKRAKDAALRHLSGRREHGLGKQGSHHRIGQNVAGLRRIANPGANRGRRHQRAGQQPGVGHARRIEYHLRVRADRDDGGAPRARHIDRRLHRVTAAAMDAQNILTLMQEASAEIKKQAQEGKCWDAVERNSSCRTTPTGQAMKTACHSSHDAIARCGSRYLSRVQQPFDTTPTLMARETKVSRIIDSMSGDKSPSLRSFELSDKARRHRQRAASTPKEMFVVTQSAQAGRQISDTQSRRAALDPAEFA